MAKTHQLKRSFILLLWGLGIVGLLVLGSGITGTKTQSPGQILESTTLTKGKSLASISTSSVYRKLLDLLPKTHELEIAAINKIFIQKGEIMQHYQESPYALLLSIHQDSKLLTREMLFNQASNLIPIHHPLRTTLSSLKSL